VPFHYSKLRIRVLANGMNFNLKEVERLPIHDLRIYPWEDVVNLVMGMRCYELRLGSF
jgi:hypothetical protein